MSDQCKHCQLMGDIEGCLITECFHHENWYAKEQQKEITSLKDALNEVCHDIRLHNPRYAHPLETIPKIEGDKNE